MKPFDIKKQVLGDTLFFSVVAFAVFYPSLNIYFVSDNISHITHAAQNFKDFDYRYFRPLPVLSLYVDYLIWGANYSGYHFTNLVIHIGNTILVYFLAKLFIKQRFFGLSAGLLFLLHPIHSLPIFWISGRTDMICALFYLSSIIMFIKFRQTGRRTYLFGSTLIFILSMLSKEMAASLPFLLFAYVLIFDRRNITSAGLKKAFYATLPFWSFLVFYGVVRFSFIGENLFGNTDHSLHSPLQLIKNFVIYLGLLSVPGGHIEIANYIKVHPSLFMVAALFCITLFIFSFRWIKKSRELLFLLIFVLLSLLPVIRLVMRWYLYIPSVGFCLAVAYFLSRIYNPEKGLRQLSVMLLLLISLIFTVFVRQEQQRWLSAGKFSREFTGKLAAAIANSDIKTCYLLNVPGELQEVPVAIYGLATFINFRLATEFNYPQQVTIKPVAYLSLADTADFNFQTVRKLSNLDYEISTEKTGAHYFFLRSDVQNTGLREGLKISDQGFQQQIEKLNARGEAVKMSINFEDDKVAVCYYSGKSIIVD